MSKENFEFRVGDTVAFKSFTYANMKKTYSWLNKNDIGKVKKIRETSNRFDYQYLDIEFYNPKEDEYQICKLYSNDIELVYRLPEVDCEGVCIEDRLPDINNSYIDSCCETLHDRVVDMCEKLGVDCEGIDCCNDSYKESYFEESGECDMFNCEKLLERFSENVKHNIGKYFVEKEHEAIDKDKVTIALNKVKKEICDIIKKEMDIDLVEDKISFGFETINREPLKEETEMKLSELDKECVRCLNKFKEWLENVKVSCEICENYESGVKVLESYGIVKKGCLVEDFDWKSIVGVK